MTVEEFTKLVISDEEVINELYEKRVYGDEQDITDKKTGVNLITYYKSDVLDYLRINKDIYFYTDLSNGFEDWVTEYVQLEQFYLLGSSIRVKVGEKDVKEYFDDVVALDVSLKEKKLIIYELDIFSEIKKTVIESPFIKEMKNLCQRVTEQTKHMLCPRVKGDIIEGNIIEVYMPEISQSLYFKGVKDIKVDTQRYKAFVSFFEKDKEDFIIEW